MMHRIPISPVAGILATFSAVLFGQANLATVTGIVADPTHGLVPDVIVTIRNVDTGKSQKELTNRQGYFTFRELQPGPYELSASSPGFATFRQNGIDLETG